MDDVILLRQRFDGVGLCPVDAMPMVALRVCILPPGTWDSAMTTHQKEIIRNTLVMSIYIKTSAMQLFYLTLAQLYQKRC